MFTPKKYKVRSGTIDSGKTYEIKTTALLSLKCCCESLDHFWIASNVNECGALDDIILFKKEENKDGITYLYQLKHQDNPKDITKDQILAKEGNFSLKKYLDSCLSLSDTITNPSSKRSDIIDYLKKNSEMVYILFTNKNVAGEFEFLKSIDSALDTINFNGSVYGFKNENLNIFTTPNDRREAFLNKIFLCVKQPHIKEIDSEIKKVFVNLIGIQDIPDKDLDEIIKKFIFFVEEWSKGLLNGHYPLTKMHVLKKIGEILLEPLMVRFNPENAIQNSEEVKEKYNLWNEMIEDKDIILINGSDQTVNEFVEKYIHWFSLKEAQSMRDSSTIKKDLMRIPGNGQITSLNDVYEYLWKINKISLVIRVTSPDEIKKVAKILKMLQEGFRIIILNETDTAMKCLERSKKLFTIVDLCKEQQMKLFRFPIKLQGRRMDGYKELEFDVKEIFNLQVKDIIYILEGKFNIGQEFEALPDIFIDISLEEVWLKPKVLQEVTDDIFLIRCACTDKFKKGIPLIEDSGIIESKNIKKYNFHYHRIILYAKEEDLNEINSYFKNSERKSVHFLSSPDNIHLQWIKSWGTISNVKDFREMKTLEKKNIVTKETISYFCTETKFMILASNPGRGKSVFVNYFAHNIPMNLWTVRINLAEYKTAYENLTNESDLKTFFKRILRKECKENLAETIFDRFYESKNVVVLLDGFDEIPIVYQNHAKGFLSLVTQLGFFVLITTRPFFKNDLELLLDTFSLDLKLFTRNDQQVYLENYYLRFCKCNKIAFEVSTINVFVENLLQAVKDSLKDEDDEFMGVPLQTLLLAEVFIDDFKTFLVTKEFIKRAYDLLYLYRNFIEKKIKIACEKFGNITEDIIYQYKIYRTFYALRLVFFEKDLEDLKIESKLECVREIFPNALYLLQKDGIVVAETEMDVRFIHQTFAEYLTAEWLTENLKNTNREITRKLLKITFRPNFKIVRSLFDRILAKDCPLHLAIINFELNKAAALIHSSHRNDLDDGGRSFLHLLGSWGAQNQQRIADLLNLIANEKLKNDRDQVFGYTPIDYAILSSTAFVGNALCEKMERPEIFIDAEDIPINIYQPKADFAITDYPSLLGLINNRTSRFMEFTLYELNQHNLCNLNEELESLIAKNVKLDGNDSSNLSELHTFIKSEVEELETTLETLMKQAGLK